MRGAVLCRVSARRGHSPACETCSPVGLLPDRSRHRGGHRCSCRRRMAVGDERVRAFCSASSLSASQRSVALSGANAARGAGRLEVWLARKRTVGGVDHDRAVHGPNHCFGRRGKRRHHGHRLVYARSAAPVRCRRRHAARHPLRKGAASGDSHRARRTDSSPKRRAVVLANTLFYVALIALAASTVLSAGAAMTRMTILRLSQSALGSGYQRAAAALQQRLSSEIAMHGFPSPLPSFTPLPQACADAGSPCKYKTDATIALTQPGASQTERNSTPHNSTHNQP